MSRISLCMLFIALMLSAIAKAEVYTWINADGVRVYGDEPPAAAKREKVSLPPIQDLPEQKWQLKDQDADTAQADSSGDEEAPEFTGYRSFKLASPRANETITSGAAGTINVQFTLEPPLQPGHEVVLLLNNKPIETSNSLSFSVQNLDRGAHLLHGQVKNQGSILKSTGKRRIHVQRPSILKRSRAQ